MIEGNMLLLYQLTVSSHYYVVVEYTCIFMVIDEAGFTILTLLLLTGVNFIRQCQRGHTFQILF